MGSREACTFVVYWQVLCKRFTLRMNSTYRQPFKNGCVMPRQGTKMQQEGQLAVMSSYGALWSFQVDLLFKRNFVEDFRAAFFLFTSLEAFRANFNEDLCIVIFHSHNFRLSRKTSLRNFSFTSLKAFKVNFVELLYILITLKLSRGTLLRIFGQQFFIHVNSKRSRRTLF